MTMHDDVDLVASERTEVGLDQQRGRRAKKDIRDVGTHHRATPAVGERGAHRLIHDVLGILVIAGMGAVQGLDHFAVNAARRQAILVPDLLPLFRSAGDIGQFASLLAEGADGAIGDILGDRASRCTSMCPLNTALASSSIIPLYNCVLVLSGKAWFT